MPERVADKDYFLDDEGNVTTDESKAVRVVARKGTAISETTAAQYGLDKLKAPESYDAVADHDATHGAETQAEADAARQRMLEGGSGDTKAQDEPQQTKQVAKAPANKGA